MKSVRNPKIIATTLLGTLFFLAVIMFSIFGGMDFAKKYPKVLNYANSTCRVDKIDSKTYECHSRYHTYTCYGPIWETHYDQNRTYAKIETEKRYRSSSDALDKAKEYEVNKIKNNEQHAFK